ncbi:MAG: hypothetical protein AAF304_09885 [Pseudomonadota bacterium]
MQLSSEDQLRLNVLVAQPLQAVRIDESRMQVHVLSEKGDASVQLNPTCKDEKYIRLVRQFLSTHFLGSPGGYPVFLRRWTRMGQARDDSLEKLLLVGEPEAVAAVVHAQGLTDELARRAWWSSATAENARRMLEKECVVKGKMGKELAQFLVEFLPFEEQQKAIIDSVNLVLQPGLIDEEMRNELWKRGNRKNSYYIGFLQQTPNALPVEKEPHNDWQDISVKLEDEIARENKVAQLLCQSLSSAGQAYLETAQLVLKKPNDQEAVAAIFNTIGDYFDKFQNSVYKWRDIEELTAFVEEGFASHQEIRKLIVIDEGFRPKLKALFTLSMISETLVDPIFGMTDAIGSVMRKRIEHVVRPITENLQVLR